MHPSTKVPPIRIACFLAGLFVIEVALQSVIERYDTTIFSVHMVQHVLVTLVGSPLLALGAAITVLLRVSRPTVRGRYILPVLHSRIVRAITFPIVAWLLFAGVMWGTPFSPLFNESLTQPLLHQLEHVAYVTAGLLFCGAAVAAGPPPRRRAPPRRGLHLA